MPPSLVAVPLPPESRVRSTDAAELGLNRHYILCRSWYDVHPSASNTNETSAHHPSGRDAHYPMRVSVSPGVPRQYSPVSLHTSRRLDEKQLETRSECYTLDTLLNLLNGHASSGRVGEAAYSSRGHAHAVCLYPLAFGDDRSRRFTFFRDCHLITAISPATTQIGDARSRRRLPRSREAANIVESHI